MALKHKIPVRYLKLLKYAQKAQSHSHSPYSGFPVGSAIELKNGKIFSGTNIENASYGVTVCAERVAICSAICAMGKININRILVTSNSENPIPPCGICRQTMAEFCEPNTEIILIGKNLSYRVFKFEKLLPYSFESSFLL